MPITIRKVLTILVLGAGLTVVVAARSTTDTARSELQLELADLLLGDERYWEAMIAYENAKQGASRAQLLRASTGLLRTLLSVAEFNRAHQEAIFLDELGSTDEAVRALQADALWASGLFAEAEALYNQILATTPSSAAARNGLAKSLAGRGQLEAALVEAQAVLAADNDRGEYYHTLGSIYRSMRRYGEAADALEEYVQRLPELVPNRRSEWARSEVMFLRSFGRREPFDIAGGREQVHTIPFRIVNDKVVVRGKVNGRDPIDLVIDTGAEQMVLSQGTAAEMGVPAVTTTISAGVGEVGVRGLDLGRVDRLEVGTLDMQNVSTIIKNPPLDGLPRERVRDSISPIAFGLSAVIDYQNHHMILARELPDEPADLELPMRVNRLAVVRGIVNQDHPRSFVVDTGGEVVSLSAGTAGSLGLVPPRHIPLRVYGTSGWDQDAFLLPGVTLAFDDLTYDNFSVVVLNLHRPSALLGFHIGGIVGHTFLRNYRVTLDIDRSVLKLTEL